MSRKRKTVGASEAERVAKENAYRVALIDDLLAKLTTAGQYIAAARDAAVKVEASLPPTSMAGAVTNKLTHNTAPNIDIAIEWTKLVRKALK